MPVQFSLDLMLKSLHFPSFPAYNWLRVYKTLLRKDGGYSTRLTEPQKQQTQT